MYKKRPIYFIFYILLLEKANQTILKVNKKEIIPNKAKYKVEEILN